MNLKKKKPTLLIDKHKIADIKMLCYLCPVQNIYLILYIHINLQQIAAPVDVLIVSNISRHFQ